MRRGRPPEHEWCDTPMCGAKHYARGKCQRHYRMLLRRQGLMHASGRTCSVRQCPDGRIDGSTRCLAHTLESEFHERGGDRSMLPPDLQKG